VLAKLGRPPAEPLLVTDGSLTAAGCRLAGEVVTTAAGPVAVCAGVAP
jgi:hypothetical protein